MIINDKLYLSWKDLEPICSDECLKKFTHLFRQGLRSTYENIQVTAELRERHNIGSEVRNLVAYDSLPEEKKLLLDSEAALRATLTSKTLEQTVKGNAAPQRYDQALKFFKANPNTYPYAQELAQQSMWLLFLAGIKPSGAKVLGYGSVDALYIAATEEMNSKGWSRWKVNSIQILRRKVRPFIALFKKPLSGNYTDVQFQQAIESLVHKGYGNSNREKLGEAQEACIFSLYANGEAKLTETQVHAFYLNIASRKISAGEWDANSIVSLSTIKNFLYRPEIKQAYWKARHGRQEFRRSFEIITHRKPASIANAMWVIDGTPWHRYYMQNGKAYARLNVYVILDAHSWCVVGFFVSEHENTEAVIGALRSACQLSGYLPHQIQYDNSSANLSYQAQACLHAIATHCTPTIVGNARSKVVEPFFKHFNNSVLRFRPGFTHSPVMANTLNGKPNPEALQKAVKGDGIPTSRAQAIKELHEDFAIWNNKPFRGTASPLQAYTRSIEMSQEHQRLFTPQVKIEAFYTMPGTMKQVKGVDGDGKLRQLQQFFAQEYTYFNDGLEITIAKQKHIFITDNPEFNKLHLSRKFLVKYDPLELEQDGIKQIYLYENTPEGIRPFVFNHTHASLSNPQRFTQALFDRQEGDGHRLYEHLQNKKLQEAGADAIGSRYLARAKADGTFMEINPANAYPKEILTAAKQQLSEQIINGDQFRITGTEEVGKEDPDQSEANQQVYVNASDRDIDRWAED